MKPLQWGRALAALLTFGILAACQAPFQDPASEGTLGTLRISVAADARSGILVPDFDMAIASLQVSGTGPEGASFGPLNPVSGVITVPNLVPGAWTLVAQGLNAAGDVVVQDTAEAAIAAARVTAATLHCVPLPGDGTFAFATTWPEGSVVHPDVQVTLTSASGQVQTFVPCVEGTLAEAALLVPAGYYTLSVRIYEAQLSQRKVVGWTKAVRIVAGQVTEGRWDLTLDQIRQAEGGALEVVIGTDPYLPLAVTLTGAVEELQGGDVMTVHATSEPEALGWGWFLDGEYLPGSGGDTVTVGRGLFSGHHSLTAVAVGPGVAGSAACTFTADRSVVFPDPTDTENARFPTLDDLVGTWDLTAHLPVSEDQSGDSDVTATTEVWHQTLVVAPSGAYTQDDEHSYLSDEGALVEYWGTQTGGFLTAGAGHLRFDRDWHRDYEGDTGPGPEVEDHQSVDQSYWILHEGDLFHTMAAVGPTNGILGSWTQLEAHGDAEGVESLRFVATFYADGTLIEDLYDSPEATVPFDSMVGSYFIQKDGGVVLVDPHGVASAPVYFASVDGQFLLWGPEPHNQLAWHKVVTE